MFHLYPYVPLPLHVCASNSTRMCLYVRASTLTSCDDNLSLVKTITFIVYLSGQGNTKPRGFQQVHEQHFRKPRGFISYSVILSIYYLKCDYEYTTNNSCLAPSSYCRSLWHYTMRIFSRNNLGELKAIPNVCTPVGSPTVYTRICCGFEYYCRHAFACNTIWIQTYDIPCP